MPENVIICPHCKKKIPLTEALGHEIKEQLQKEFESQAKKREKELAVKEKALADRESSLNKKADSLEKAKETVEQEVEQKLKTERKKLEERLRKQAEEELGVELKGLQAELKENKKKIKGFQEMELKLRGERRQLEEDKEDLKLEVARTIDAERKKIRGEAIKQAVEEQRLKDQEKDRLIGGLKGQIDDLKRRVEQGSQQAQGEVLELDLEDFLRAQFPSDIIEPVPKGIRGADILQRVHSESGTDCGTIVWETKRTKNWSQGWIDKLKEDQRTVQAEIAVLLSMALPKEIDHFARINGVWVTDYSSVPGLVTVLRWSLIEVATTKLATVGKNEKMELLYDYLSGSEFKQVVEAIVESFIVMKQDLDQERRAMERIWKKREKQIDRVVKNVGSMYGSMQGIIGASLPQIESLDLKALTDGSESVEEGV